MKKELITRFLAVTLSVVFFGLYFILAMALSADITPKDERTISIKSLQLCAKIPDNIALSNTRFTPHNSSKTEKSGDIIKGKNGENKNGYDSNDLLWLSKIIYAEAGTEPLEGKLAVGSVVMNRVMSESYPDTVYDVIFDTKFGTQFTPAATGTVHKSPDEESILAAKMCLGGYSVSEEILFFLNESLSTSTWMQDNCTFVMSIGNHDFYS